MKLHFEIERLRKRFLLFPKTIQGETRWLEVAIWRESKHSRDWFQRLLIRWNPNEWLTEQEAKHYGIQIPKRRN